MTARKAQSLEDWLDKAEMIGMKTLVKIGKPPGRQCGNPGELKTDALSKLAGVMLSMIEDIRTNGPDPKKIFEVGRIYGQLEAMTERDLLQKVTASIVMGKRRLKGSRKNYDLQTHDMEIIEKASGELDMNQNQTAKELYDNWNAYPYNATCERNLGNSTSYSFGCFNKAL